jgi:uncharacterized membrane protein
MARRITIQRYPLLKVTIPLALVVAAVGLYLFLSQSSSCAGADDPVPGCRAGSTYATHDTMTLLPWLGVAALIALVGAFIKKREDKTLLFPTDQLKDSSRADLQKVLDGLEEARAKGEIPEERYVNARNRVLAEMKGKGK